MKIIIFIIFITLPLNMRSQTQIFNGKLTYKLIPTHKLQNKDSLLIGKNLFKSLSDTSTLEVLISGNKLVSKHIAKTGEVINLSFANENDSYILDVSDYRTKIKFNNVPGNLHTVSSAKKTNETKQVLGLQCRKYIYSVDGNIFNVWLPENLLYLKQRSYGGFFDNYFFPNGLAFEKESILESTNEKIHVLYICKIEIFKPTDKDFENFVDEAKKQSNHILKKGAKE